MPSKERNLQLATEAMAKKKILSEVPDEQIACRLGHDWPKLRAGKRTLPKNFRVVPQRDGCAQLVETCSNCGKQRWKTTLPGGFYNRNAVYVYENPPKWVRIPRDAGIKRIDIDQENHERTLGPWIATLIDVAQKSGEAL